VTTTTGKTAGLPGAAMLPPVASVTTPNYAVRPPNRGRFAEINEFIDFSMANLTPAARSVWLILWRDTKPNGLARTGQANLARRAGVTERAVRMALTELTSGGLVRVVRKGRVGAGPSTYRVRGINPGQRE
jgi:hypothetical protein